jgi:hypothetical protein
MANCLNEAAPPERWSGFEDRGTPFTPVTQFSRAEIFVQRL